MNWFLLTCLTRFWLTQIFQEQKVALTKNSVTWGIALQNVANNDFRFYNCLPRSWSFWISFVMLLAHIMNSLFFLIVLFSSMNYQIFLWSHNITPLDIKFSVDAYQMCISFSFSVLSFVFVFIYFVFFMFFFFTLFLFVIVICLSLIFLCLHQRYVHMLLRTFTLHCCVKCI